MRPHSPPPSLFLLSFGLALAQLACAAANTTLTTPLNTPTLTSPVIDGISGLPTWKADVTVQTYSNGQPTQPPEPPDVNKRWNNICRECVGSTGTTRFKGAHKSLTNDNDGYTGAKTTVLTTKRKKIKTSDGCTSTITKKAKKTMYVVWVRPDSFANNQPYQDTSDATGLKVSILLCGLGLLLGATLVL